MMNRRVYEDLPDLTGRENLSSLCSFERKLLRTEGGRKRFLREMWLFDLILRSEGSAPTLLERAEEGASPLLLRMMTEDIEDLRKEAESLPAEEGPYAFNDEEKEGLYAGYEEEGSAFALARIAEKYYRTKGKGQMAEASAFHRKKGKSPDLLPIRFPRQISFDEIFGYESQKKRLRENTESFLRGGPAQNCLLFGESGTGKSSCIQALLTEYAAEGLRMIELHKEDLSWIQEILMELEERPYRFLLCFDDLSFEDGEESYKSLKAILEGSLRARPENVRIYATSNRRHLIRESIKDAAEKDEELHSMDTAEEKLSLSQRFGCTIWFGRPNKKEYEGIVEALAKRHGLALQGDELLLRANAFALRRGGRSGRVAEQFVLEEKKKEEKQWH